MVVASGVREGGRGRTQVVLLDREPVEPLGLFRAVEERVLCCFGERQVVVGVRAGHVVLEGWCSAEFLGGVLRTASRRR